MWRTYDRLRVYWHEICLEGQEEGVSGAHKRWRARSREDGERRIAQMNGSAFSRHARGVQGRRMPAYTDDHTVSLPLGSRRAARPFVVTRMVQPMTSTSRLPARARWSIAFLPAMLALFAVLNVLDLVSTFIGLHSGMREGNPLMSGLLLHYGFGALIIYKVVVILAVTLGVYFLCSIHMRIARTTISVCNVLVLGVVLVNVAQFAALG
jgi:hypothetical protein